MRGKASKGGSDAAKLDASLESIEIPIDWKVLGYLKIRDQTVNLNLARRDADGR